MSFGYLQGQEAQALAYYQKFIETQADPKIRQQLEKLIAELQKVVDEKKQKPPAENIQHAVS
ncbi:MAG TPA: hypothetical protein VMD27_12170 [Candidatus Aquilonibacter sp.]|nr:hypothetical protein [Candidatus Aquilonibacter sp.]